MAQAEQAPTGRTHSGRFGRLVVALAAGLAGGLIAPLLYPSLSRNGRPAAKKALKAGMAALEQGRIKAAELAEHAADLMAEARSEFEDERKSADPQAGTGSEVVALRGSGREAAGI